MKEIEKEFDKFLNGCQYCKGIEYCREIRLLNKNLSDIKSEINDSNRSFYENTIRNITNTMIKIKDTCSNYVEDKKDNPKFNKVEDLKILYLDYNTVKATILNKILSKFFLNLETCYKYKKSLSLISQNHYALMIIDLNSLNMSRDDMRYFLNEIKGLNLLIYIFCNSCGTCKDKLCPKILNKENIRYFELPVDLRKVLNFLYSDLNIKDPYIEYFI